MRFIISLMKQLSDDDILQMTAGEFAPDLRAVNRDVRAKLKLRQLIPPTPVPVAESMTLDLHEHTEEQAWAEIVAVIHSGARYATVITGASGILRQKFPQWMTESILAPYIISYRPINNGSFHVHIHGRKQKLN